MDSYDYIVVGAGAAGAVVANRLTEDPAVSVLLLEAGGRTHHHLFVRMPMAFLLTNRREKFGWNFETEPEPALDGRSLGIFRGRALGGSTTVNGMFYTRGNRVDYDMWRQLGLPGWSYADVLPYFRKLETSWRGDTRYHGGSGPIHVMKVDDPALDYQAFQAAAVRAGLPRSDDLYGDVTTGVGRAELSIGNGERSNTARAYIDPALRRPNLHVVTGAFTRRVLLDGRRATGVEYRRDGEVTEARARREVILCAGTFKTPQILMLSGIGPTDQLREHGVTPQVDLPGVGANLQDHQLVVVTWQARGTDTFLRHLRWDRAARHMLRWHLSRSGPYVNTTCYATIYAETLPGLARPDVQLVATGLGLDSRPWFPRLTPAPAHKLACIISTTHSESRGWVRLRSADPDDKPRILFNALADPRDLDTLVRGVRLARKVYAQPPQSDLVTCELDPGVAVDSDADLADFVRATVRSAEHGAGTCRMGVGADAVVDAELRVRGIAGLRVIDASVMPDEPGGNTNIPTIMIAEKGADLVRGQALAPAG